MGTLDAHVVALDAKTGRVRWDAGAADATRATASPSRRWWSRTRYRRVAGGESGVRGFIDAYEVETGKRAWRFHTIPGEGEPGRGYLEGRSWKRGGAPAWVTGSYDPG